MRPRKRLASSRGVTGLVSVIIATRDRPQQLSRLLKSVRIQTYGRIETIIVNDSSATDISKLGRKYSVKLVIKTNAVGRAAASNEGFLRSRGEFVIFPDDDMELRPTMIAKLVRALTGNPSKAYVYCGFREVERKHVVTVGPAEFDPKRLVLFGNYINMTSLIRREKFVEVGMFDPSLRRLIDWDLWVSFLERGEDGVPVPEILFEHVHLGGPRISSEDNPLSLPIDVAMRLVERKHSAIKEKFLRESDPLGMLLQLYWVRKDLQDGFPEVQDGKYHRLINWAASTNDRIPVIDRRWKITFSELYKNSPILSQSSKPLASAIDWSGALSTLMNVYKAREDLRTAFPEAARGDEKNLVQWAARIVLGEDHDGDVSTLRLYGAFYASVTSQNELKEVRNELSLRTEQINGLKNELAIRIEGLNYLRNHLETKTQEITDLRNSLMQRTEELDDLRKQLSLKSEELSKVGTKLVDSQANLKTASLEIDNLRVKFTKTRSELEELKQSFGYQFMKFYGSKVDGLFPVGTRRRELKKIMSRSARIAIEEGVGALPPRIWWKLKKHQFTLVDHAVQLEPTVQIKEVKESVTMQELKAHDGEQSAQVVGSCDHPPLSSGTVARVAGSFMVSGWALAQEGIDRIDIYLDDAHLGPAIYGTPRPDVMKAFPGYPGADKSGFTKFVSLDADGKAHTLRIVAMTRAQSSLILEGKIAVQETLLVEAPLSDAALRPTGPTSSVIIMTKTPPPDFEQTLQGLRRQDRIVDPEIIIINSGQSDLSGLSERYRAKVLNISAQEFGHSGTRNLGAETATADYVIYMTDDAIPASNDLLSSMIKFLESDKNVAAATARQIPRSDSDLMNCQALWGHYKMLNLTEDRVAGTDHFDELTATQKRQICQIDDVCSCYRRSTLLEYKFAPRYSYAEDLELGMRLIKDGYKIAQLYSTGVIHSHIRPATYFLKRAYVNTKALSQLLEYDLTSIRKFADTNNDGTRLIASVFESVVSLYDALCNVINDFKNHAFYAGDISKIFASIEEQMKGSRTTISLKDNDTELSKFLEQIASVAEVNLARDPRQNSLGPRYVTSIRTFEQWLLQTRSSMMGLENDFIEALYKLLGIEIGTILAECYLWVQTTGLQDESFRKLDSFLSSDV